MDVDDNKAKITKNTADIAPLKIDVDDNKAKITKNTADIASLNMDVEAKITQNAADIITNAANITANSDNIVSKTISTNLPLSHDQVVEQNFRYPIAILNLVIFLNYPFMIKLLKKIIIQSNY